MNKAAHNFDVIIVGGGLIGLLQALSLAQYDVRCAIIDQSDIVLMQSHSFDGRTSALTSASMNMLNMLNLDKAILGQGAPIEKIIVRDGNDGPPICFDDDAALANVFENQKLRIALLDAALKHDNITPYFSAIIAEHNSDDYGVHILMDDGTNLRSHLLIGADGRNSQVRQSAQITLSQWSYNHHALVGAIAHEKPHDNIAHELFFNEGPLALLPMTPSASAQHRSSLIWSVPQSQSNAYQKLSPKILAHELDKKTNGLLGKSNLIAPLISYPLGFHSAVNLTAKRVALIGDSAHRVHPIAGQGLNLGFRDVAALTEALVDGTRLGLECGDAQLLARYERWRSVDNLTVCMATDGINQLYAIPGKTAQGIRRMGMDMIQKSERIKAFLTQEARGEAGELPKMLSATIL